MAGWTPAAPQRLLAFAAGSLALAIAIAALLHLIAVTLVALLPGRALLDARHGLMLYVGVTAIGIALAHAWVAWHAWRGSARRVPVLLIAMLGALAWASVALTPENGGFWIGVAWEALVAATILGPSRTHERS